jgi:hypothetical protein
MEAKQLRRHVGGRLNARKNKAAALVRDARATQSCEKSRAVELAVVIDPDAEVSVGQYHLTSK